MGEVGTGGFMLTEQDKKELITLIDERMLTISRQKVTLLSKLDILYSLRNRHLENLMITKIDRSLFFRRKVKRNVSSKERAVITKMEGSNQVKRETAETIIELIDLEIKRIKDKEAKKNEKA